MRWLLFLLFLIPVAAIGQYHITGKVLNIIGNKPVAEASVFLGNASAGAKTNTDGSFDIVNVHSGHYELVVSIVGFATYRQNIVVTGDLNLPDILIEEKSITLKEVRIGPDPNWDRNYSLFKREFLGNSENAKECKILNPDVLTLNYENGELTGSSYDFIIIENKALGYRLKYLLSEFTKKYSAFSQSMLYYAGTAFFENLPGTKSQIRHWQKNRLNAYLGSDMHFLRSVVANRVAEEGFTVRRLIRQNGDAPGKRGHDDLVNTPLTVSDYVKLTTQQNEYALAFKDCLYINYKKDGEKAPVTSIISFKGPYIYFDNGIIINPENAVMEDAWGYRRVADMLPVDYETYVK